MISARAGGEADTFVGYRDSGCGWAVAVFRRAKGEYLPTWPSGWAWTTEFVLDRGSCAERLRNFRALGLPHDQTATALAGWPADGGAP